MARKISLRALLANERTFLAWLRTAVALMAFGFVVDKFDLFVRLRVPSHVAPHSGPTGAAFGMAMVFAGLVVILGAALRYWSIRRDIRSGTTRAAENPRTPLVTAGLLIVVGVALLLYLWTAPLHA